MIQCDKNVFLSTSFQFLFLKRQTPVEYRANVFCKLDEFACVRCLRGRIRFTKLRCHTCTFVQRLDFNMFITVSLSIRVTATRLRCQLVCFLDKCPSPQCFVARSYPGTVGSPACSNDVTFRILGGLLAVLSTYVEYQHTSPEAHAIFSF